MFVLQFSIEMHDLNLTLDFSWDQNPQIPVKKKCRPAKCVVAQGKEAVSTAALVMVRARNDDDHMVSLTNGETDSQDYLHCMASRFLLRDLSAESKETLLGSPSRAALGRSKCTKMAHWLIWFQGGCRT